MELKPIHFRVLLAAAVVIAPVALIGSFLVVRAAPPTTPYAPGETLTPNCAPGATNCTVVAPATAGANTNITSLGGLTTALTVNQGGTGVNASSAANGQLLIGNGTGFTLNTITAGTGITVTNGTGTITIDATGGGAGEANTASNLGTGSNVFKAKSGVDLQFRKLNAGSSKLSVTQNADDISFDVVEGNIDIANLTGNVPISRGGTGLSSAPTSGQLLIGKSDGTYQIANLTAGTNITITNSSGGITIDSTGGGGGGSGEANTASNSGVGGVGVFILKTGVDLTFKNINVGSSKLSVTSDVPNNEIDLDVNEGSLTLNNIGGTLGQSKGGTGLDLTTATNGQLLVGTGSGVSLATITAGSGITVTNASGSITIAATGGGGGGEANTASNVGTGVGQFFYQKTGADLEFRGISAASTKIAITNGTGNAPVTVDVNQANLSLGSIGGTLNLGSQVTGTLGPTSGGTGLTSYTTGDTLYASASNTLSKLAAGTAGQVLTMAGGVPTWATASSGFSDPMTTRGDIIYRNASNVTVRLGRGTAGQVLKSDGTDIAWQTLTGSDVGLGNVENTALSTWAGSSNLTTLGTVTTGTWSATAIGPTKGGTGLTTYTTGDTLFASATNTLSKLAIGTAGQVLTIAGGVPTWAAAPGGETNTASNVGAGGTGVFKQKTGVDLEFRNVNAASTKISVALDAPNNEIDIDVNQANLSLGSIGGTLNLGTQVTGTLGPTNGGTGSATYTTGDTLYASATNVLSKLTAGSAGQVLTMAGGVPTWAAVAYTETDPLSVLKATFTTNGDLLYGTGAGTYTRLGAGSAGQVLTISGGIPAWAAATGEANTASNVGVGGVGSFKQKTGVDLEFRNVNAASTKISVALDAPNNEIDIDVNQANLSLGSIGGTLNLGTQVTGTLGPTNGGTGSATYTTGDTLYASATNTLSKLTAGTAGQVLTMAGGVPTWATPSSGFSDPMTTRGDIIYRNASNVTVRLGRGTAGQVLKSDGTDIAWQTLTGSDVGLGNVENTALSTWAGSSNLTTLGTVTTGTWSATAIGPTKGGTGLTTYTTGDTLFASATNTLSKLAIGTAGQVLTIAGGVPTWAAATGEANTASNVGTGVGQFFFQKTGIDLEFRGISAASTKIAITNGTGNAPVTVDVNQANLSLGSIGGTLSLGTQVTGTLGPTNGGTGIATYATGDTLFASASNTLSKLAAGTAGQILTMAGGVPTWAAAPSAATLQTAYSAGATITTAASTAIAFTLTSGGFSAIGAGAITLGNNTGTVAVDSTSWDVTTAGVASGFTGFTTTGNVTVSGANITAASPFSFDGATADAVKTVFAITDPTVSTKTITFPNATGTVAVSATSPITLSALGDIGCSTCITTGSTIGPTAGGTGITTYTTGDTLYASATNVLSKLAIGTAGQVLTVSGGVPTWAAATGEANTASNVGTGVGQFFFQKTGVNLEFRGISAASTKIAITNGAGNAPVTVDVNQANLSLGSIGGTLNLSTQVTGTLGPTNGGTGLATYATGDTLFASAANTLSKLAAGTAGQVLTMAGGVPTWAAASSATLQTAYNAGATITTAASTAIAFTLTSGGFSAIGAGAITLGNNTGTVAVDSTSWDVSTAGVASGFTGFTTTGNVTVSGANITGASPLSFDGATANAVKTIFAITDPTTSSKTITFPDATGTVAVTASAPLAISVLGNITCATCLTTSSTIGPTAGGTGITTYATGDMLYASATNTLSKLAIGTAGQILTVAGGVPTWAAAPSAATLQTAYNAGATITTAASTAIAFTLTSGGFSAIGAGAITLGNNTGTVAIDSTSWDVSTAGVASGFTGFTTTGNVTVSGANITGASPLSFDGATANAVKTIFAITDPTTSSKTITFPDASGTVAVTASAPLAISALGNITCATCLTSGTTLFTLAGSTGPSQAIASGDTLSILAGSNVTTTASATDTVTIATSLTPTFTSMTTGTITMTANTGIVIPDATVGSPSAFTINDSAGNNMFTVRDMGAGNHAFGSMVTAGAFVSRNSYAGVEYSVYVPGTCSADTSGARGEGHPFANCSTANGGSLSIDETVVGGTATCNWTSLADTVNGVERSQAATGTGTSAACLEYHSSQTANDPQLIFNAANKPVMTVKARPSAIGTTQTFFVGISDAGTAARALPSNGFIFTNCTNTGCTTASTNWQAVMMNGGTGTFTDCGVAISTTQFAFLRAEVRLDGTAGNSDVRYFVDGDVSNGITETECGTGVTAATPTGNVGLTLSNTASATALTMNLDVDYIRVFQDDAMSDIAASSGPMPALVPDYLTGRSVTSLFPTTQAERLIPGTVVSLDRAHTDPYIKQSVKEYDTDLFGVITEADGEANLNNGTFEGAQVAISGTVRVKVSSGNGMLVKGDLLTSSSMPGIAMKATKPGPVFGRVVALLPGVEGELQVIAEVHPVMWMQPWGNPLEVASANSASGASLGQTVPFRVTDDFNLGGYSVIGVKELVGMNWKIDEYGKLFAHSVEIQRDGKLVLPAGKDQIVGELVIPANTLKVHVTNVNVNAQSTIFLTASRELSQTPAVVEQGNGYFDVSLKNTEAMDLKIRYLLIESNWDVASPLATASIVMTPTVVPVAVSQTSPNTSNPFEEAEGLRAPPKPLPYVFVKLLAFGAKGEAVVALQERLNKDGYLHMPATIPFGTLGSYTVNALREYQAQHGLPRTGKLDAATISALNGQAK